MPASRYLATRHFRKGGAVFAKKPEHSRFLALRREVIPMTESKREALARLEKALKAHEANQITGLELAKIVADVRDNPNVKSQNVDELVRKFRSKLVKNSR